jgi:hypothetical protein
MTSTPYPNGQVLTSTALTVSQINAIIQPLTCDMIGMNPPDFLKVRVDWQSEGQPFVPRPQDDVCFISCVPENVDYRLVRDRTFSGTGPVVETWVYTRGWRVSWVLYGPNSTDRARMIHSAFFMDYFNDSLSLSNLYPVSDFAEPTRVPENLNAQWFERADFHVVMYEQVTETIDDGAVTSVEVKINADDLGQVTDFTVTKPS